MTHPVHLILSPGTRVVTRNDANRIGGGQLIPAGAVAVITESPADGQHAYKVRFNDGTKAMLKGKVWKKGEPEPTEWNACSSYRPPVTS